MESDEEAFIEVEIQKGLDKLTEADLESSDTSASDVLNSDNSSSEDVNEVLNSGILIGEEQNYGFPVKINFNPFLYLRLNIIIM